MNNVEYYDYIRENLFVDSSQLKNKKYSDTISIYFDSIDDYAECKISNYLSLDEYNNLKDETNTQDLASFFNMQANILKEKEHVEFVYGGCIYEVFYSCANDSSYIDEDEEEFSYMINVYLDDGTAKDEYGDYIDDKIIDGGLCTGGEFNSVTMFTDYFDLFTKEVNNYFKNCNLNDSFNAVLATVVTGNENGKEVVHVLSQDDIKEKFNLEILRIEKDFEHLPKSLQDDLLADARKAEEICLNFLTNYKNSSLTNIARNIDDNIVASEYIKDISSVSCQKLKQ